MRLSKRLQAIADIVIPCTSVADIGCDHAQLSVALIEQKKCKHVYASDLRLGPILRAKETVEENEMSNQITCIHGDGLEGVHSPLDCIVIAGMGFETIQHILENGKAKAHAASQIVLASHTQVKELREWLYTQGYRIDNESIVYDKFYYEILSVHYEPNIIYEAFDFEIGEYASSDKLFKQMMKHKIEVLDQVLQSVPKSSAKYTELDNLRIKYLDQIEKVM